MKFRTTWRLLLAVCVLGLAICLVEQRFASTRQSHDRAESLLGDRLADVQSLTLQQADTDISCFRRGNTWQIDRPLRAAASVEAIERILYALETLTREEVISPHQFKQRGLTLEDYGLAEPRARLVVGDRFGRTAVRVGLDAPLTPWVYVQLSDDPSVVAVPNSLLDVFPAGVDALRDRVVVSGDAARCVRLEIARPGAPFIQLARNNGDWSLQQPIAAHADSHRVAGMLAALYTMRVQSFAWDPPNPGPGEAEPDESTVAGQMAPYGLAPDEAAARITVWTKGEEAGRELLLGKAAGEDGAGVYARRRELPSVYVVSKDILAVFSTEVDDLRDRRLFPLEPAAVRHVRAEVGDRKLVLERRDEEGWMVVDPVRWRADEEVVRTVVERLVNMRVTMFTGSTVTNLADAGLDQPAFTLALGESDADTAANRLRVGWPVPETDRRYVKFESSDEIYQVREAELDALGDKPANPLLYFDRSMLAVTRDAVKSVSLTRQGETQTVALEAPDLWRPMTPTNGVVNTNVVADALFLVSNLRALRIEARNPESLAAYGLDRGDLALTLGLSGAEGIQKSIILGFRSRTDGVYAMVKGRDLVFVVPNAVADQLARSLLKE